MNLQKKLFLSIGIVIFLVIIPLFSFSEYLLKKDISRAEQEVEALILQKETQAKEDLIIIDSFSKLQGNLEQKLSLHLIVVSAVFVIIAFLLLWRITKSIISPITKLASETDKIAKGKYEELILPDVSKRTDEIAKLTHSFESMVQGLKDREKIRSVLDKVVSKEVAEEVLKTHIHLGGEDRTVTMLFSDIRGFTKMTEHFPPQRTIEMLNAFMTKMTRVIEAEGGVIDKYIGDEIMALYGVPVFHSDHAIRALSTAKIMVETLKKWNIEREKAGKEIIEIGIGIHTGLVVAGNVGAEDRLNYTVLGASVNLASRLCQAAAPMQILISEYTLSEPDVKDSFLVQSLPPINVKGFSNPVNNYEIVGFKW